MPPKKSDSLVWKYVTRDGNELFCKECKKPFKGSLTRARDHLLGISGGKGGGVSACPKMTAQMRAGLEREQSSSIVGMLKTTQKKQRIQEDVSRFTSISSSSSLPNASSSLPKATGASGESGTLKSFWKPVEKQQVDDALADLFYTSAIPFNVARNPHFRNAIQKVAEFGKGYTPPTSEAFKTTLLERSKDRVTEKLAEVKASWKVTVIDTMNQKKTSEYIFQILDEAIVEVGVENVVQVVTDSAANCVGAGKLIVEKYPQIYWSPCAAHCLDLLLHDLAKFPWIHEAIHRGRAVANFIRNHRLTLSLYRQHASRELLRPCDTRFASFYITLKRVIEEKAALRLVVCSNEWESSALSKSAKGKNIEQIILSSNFWESGAKVLNICGPIVDRALNNVEAEYMEIWETVDSRWKMMHTPLHAAACYLEPKLFHIDRQADPEIMPGFYEAISRFEQDRTIAGLIRDQSWKYKRAEGLFGIEAARDDMTRDEVPSYRWWMSYGAQNPELQRFAIRILSQGASSSASNDSTSSSQQQISEGMVTGVADEPEDDFVDDELGSDTDDYDATAATQPCALDDLELF
ncbi:uncharacterized protein LOC131045108 [Cryptomeria japonica]|uniref:uncharacterized protein LOC131045108 n=1 Tax=Cryptomeria japonica TaxID=3369 RepID=UPI0027D9EE30|nr:uncharacterized protein LOC131045108 [Cryptomeria japonica]